MFQKYFPITLKMLGPRAQDICRLYVDEMGFSEGEVQSGEDLRYFAGFVRQNFRNDSRLIEVAQWEAIHCLLEEDKLSFEVKADPGTVVLNPSYQVLVLNAKNIELHRDQGLYIFVRNSAGELIEHRLESFEALLIDLILEDRKYSPEQLLSIAFEEKEIALPSTEEGQKKFKSLLHLDILRLV